MSEIFGVVGWDTPSTPVLRSSSNLVKRVLDLGVGLVQIEFNIQVQSTLAPVLLTSSHVAGTYAPRIATYNWDGNAAIRVSVKDLSGNGVSDSEVGFMVLGQDSAITL